MSMGFIYVHEKRLVRSAECCGALSLLDCREIELRK